MLAVISTLVIAPQTWTMVLGGDIMLNGIKTGTSPLAGVAKSFSTAGFAYANLEIPLTDGKERTIRKTKAELKARSQYILRADTKHIDDVAACGFDVVSLANNHAMDYSYKGLREMQSLLTGFDILYCGAGENLAAARMPARYTTPGGIRIAVLSFLAFQTANGRWKCTPATEKTPGVAEIHYDGKLIRKVVTAAHKNSDLVVVALHWGLEKHMIPSSYQVKLGRAFIDAGADLIAGSHPHVLQGAEMYKNKPILYSLGNLVSPRPSSTGLLRLTYNDKSLKGMEFLPCSIAGAAVKRVTKGANFAAMCKSVASKYPSKWSRQPKIR